MHMRTDDRAFDRISLIEGLLLRRVVIYAKLSVSASCQNARGQLSRRDLRMYFERGGGRHATDCTVQVHVILIDFLI